MFSQGSRIHTKSASSVAHCGAPQGGDALRAPIATGFSIPVATMVVACDDVRERDTKPRPRGTVRCSGSGCLQPQAHRAGSVLPDDSLWPHSGSQHACQEALGRPPGNQGTSGSATAAGFLGTLYAEGTPQRLPVTGRKAGGCARGGCSESQGRAPNSPQQRTAPGGGGRGPAWRPPHQSPDFLEDRRGRQASGGGWRLGAVAPAHFSKRHTGAQWGALRWAAPGPVRSQGRNKWVSDLVGALGPVGVP